jgi:hypothetical protein
MSIKIFQRNLEIKLNPLVVPRLGQAWHQYTSGVSLCLGAAVINYGTETLLESVITKDLII